jgi:hypothetical protein
MVCGVNFSFSTAPTAPINASTHQGGAGINYYQPQNTLSLDILDELAAGINKEGNLQIFCPN